MDLIFYINNMIMLFNLFFKKYGKEKENMYA
jgi:hypothetical protein